MNAETTSTVRDAEGRSIGNYCDGFDVSSSVRALFDVSGKTMIEVYNQARNAGFTNLFINNAATALGTATFPAESKLFYQTNTSLSTAIAYGPSRGNELLNTNAAIAAGNTSASDTTAACASILPSTPQSSYTAPATTLESFIAANPATPCHYSPNSMQVPSTSGTPVTVSSGPRNEWWNNSTATMGQLGNAPVGVVQQAGWKPSTRPTRCCAWASVPATWPSTLPASSAPPMARRAIATRSAPARIRSPRWVTRGSWLANTPPQAASLQERVFVERGGKVRVGYKNRTSPNSTARLNLQAANALLGKLGMEQISPDAPFALTPASYQGDWQVWNAADVNGVDWSILRIAPTYNGTGTADYLCFDSTGQEFTCTLTLDAATGGFTLVDSDGTLTGTLGMASGASDAPPSSRRPERPETIVGRRR